MKNIVLIGLSGSGKTTIGERAAKAAGLGFFDMDSEIESTASMSIRNIFAKFGEEKFRDLETEMAKEAARLKKTVISTGGGAVLRAENRKTLGENALVVFLDRPPEQIAETLDSRNRPLLAEDSDRIFLLDRERRPLYEAYADVSLPCANGLDEALACLIALIRSEYPGEGFALIGDPVAHSMSPLIHDAVFDSIGESRRYGNIHVRKGTLGEFVPKLRASGLGGINVTIPHKMDIIPFLDEIEEEARLCGAVNTVVVRGGRLHGYNTDMGGLLQALRGKGHAYQGRRVVLLGAGGASAGIALKTAEERAEKLVMLCRRPEEAEKLLRGVQAAFPLDAEALEMTPENLAAAAAGADVLINATPLGMHGIQAEHESFAFLKRLPAGALVCDLIYNPARTRLLREAEALGLATLNGMGMLLYQALLADERFLGRTLDKPALCRVVIDSLDLQAYGV
ncbi:MAG: shikimate dehydrogenase [Clostridiales Family XIII bacterium]|jgi:shikimate dehydrogenase|nr:shikimate dehydrogenase [Clostridiales Family XIII bacterium]